MNSEGQGTYVEIPGAVDRIPPYDSRSGDHYWIIICSFQVHPEQFKPGMNMGNLDHENLVNVAGPGCYHCEQGYTSFIATRRCPGPPRGRR